jgi:hypothetical protein
MDGEAGEIVWHGAESSAAARLAQLRYCDILCR